MRDIIVRNSGNYTVKAVNKEKIIGLLKDEMTKAVQDSAKYEPSLTLNEIRKRYKFFVNNEALETVYNMDVTEIGILALDSDDLKGKELVISGKYGEDGRIQGLCRMTGLPVIGNDMSSANITQDRKLTNIVLKDAGFDVADYMTLSRDEIDDIESAMEKVMKSFSFPLYVAATSCSSSIGAYRAENKEQLCEAIKTAFSHHPVIIIENELKGRIIECAIITRERGEDYIELGELVPDADTDSSEFVAATYDFVIPAALDSDMAQKVKEVAKSAFKVLSCRCYARIDLLLCEDKIYVRRVRGVPGLEDNNIFTRLMTNSSFEYSEMLDYLISSAIDKR